MEEIKKDIVENPFELPAESEMLELEPKFEIVSNDVPRWPAGSPTETKGEFGAGDKAHQERAKASGKALGHPAMDIVYPIGTSIYSMLPGKVIAVFRESSPWKKGKPTQGNAVKIDHYNYGLTSFYAHLSTINVSEGQEVDQTTQIGTVGTSGNALGTATKENDVDYGHVHFEVKKDGQPKNPKDIITGAPIVKNDREARMKIMKQIIKEASIKNVKYWEDED